MWRRGRLLMWLRNILRLVGSLVFRVGQYERTCVRGLFAALLKFRWPIRAGRRDPPYNPSKKRSVREIGVGVLGG